MPLPPFISLQRSLLLFSVITYAQTLSAKAAEPSLSELEARLEAIDAELATLPNPSMRSGVGSIGYRSQWREDAAHREWFEIELGGEFPIDEIILVPIILRNAEGGFQADAFPQNFIIRAGSDNNGTGTIIAQFPSPGAPPLENAPLVIPIQQTTATWVRLETTELPKRAFDKNHVLQLSEVLVLNGPENMALRRPVTASSVSQGRVDAWSPQYLTDGLVPYLMDAAGGRPSVAYLTRPATNHVLTLDLDQAYPLSRIHLHTVEQSDTVPQASAGDLGILTPLKIEGANHSDFSDAVPLLEIKELSQLDIGPIMMWPTPEATSRYIRITAKQPRTASNKNYPSQLGFAEIELFSQGKNIALGKLVHNSNEDPRPNRPLNALTDGNNLYGAILPVRKWLEGLARRHTLEVERTVIAPTLQQQYTAQKVRLRQLSWLAATLILGVGLFIFIERLLHQREMTQLRLRFAADIHDELGADLHVIGMLGELAQSEVDSPETLRSLHERIRDMTRRTVTAVRQCARMIENQGLCEDLPADMRRFTKRILADILYTFTLTGEENLLNFHPRTRADLFLFYKECLVNISRHSAATECRIDLTATPGEIRLTVEDNGGGLPETSDAKIPYSLKRRAQLLRGELRVESIAGAGTTIRLTRKKRRWFFAGWPTRLS